MQEDDKFIVPLSDEHLLNMAMEIGERWEDIFQQGLIAKGEIKSVTTACLPQEQMIECRKIAPKDFVLQAYHALARWRWFCLSNSCPDKLILTSLTNAVKSCGIPNMSIKLQTMNNAYNSLDYV